MNHLTNRTFWLDYWKSKDNLIYKIPDTYPFLRLLEALIKNYQIKSSIEIGGFPGYYSVWLKRNLNIDVTLFDFVIHLPIIRQLAAINQVEPSHINTLESDLFEYIPDQKYDLVFSNGLIEHFEDTRDIVSKHISFLSENGILFITLPNFRGINGWFQETFDPSNYRKHHIECMDLHYLRSVCDQLNLKDIHVFHHGEFMLWLENEKSHPIWVRLLRLLIWFPLKVISKLLPFESRTLSPYIVITAHL